MLLKTYHNLLSATAEGICDTNIDHLLKIYRDLVQKYRIHRGKTDMVNHMKNLNTLVERYSMYQPIEPLKFRKSDVEGFPHEIRQFKPYLRNENPVIVKIALSIFRSCELLRLPPSHDLTTVLRQPSYDVTVVEEIIQYIPNFVAKLPKLQYKDLYYHFTVKNGPNGPALATSDKDLFAVRQDADIYNALRTVSIELNDKEFPDEDYQVEGPGIHSKLTQFSEKSGKTRTIAVVDYYSQRALHPLHQGLMSLLRKIPSDGTFSHKNVGNYAKEATKDKSFIATSDMTAFTDLFPAILQQKLLESLVPNKDLANAWWTLLAKRTFTVAWSGDQVSYGTGQPMGAYASWPLCTLAHHLVMHYSAYKHSIKNVNKYYRILGDDNERTNKILSDSYEETLHNLGCELNPGKGTLSREGVLNSSAEVAKRLYLNGVDISPLTPGLLNTYYNPMLLNNTLKDLMQTFDNQTLPVHILNNVISKKKREKCWMLCTNPFNGAIKPGNPGYDEHSDIWEPFEEDQLHLAMIAYRVKRLLDKADDIDRSEDLFMLNLKLKPKLGMDDFTGGDMELRSAPQYAQRYCKKHIFEMLKTTILKLQYSSIDQQPLENAAILDEVEYIADIRNPFKDSKDLRNTQATLLVEKVYTYLEAGKDAQELIDDIDIIVSF